MLTRLYVSVAAMAMVALMTAASAFATVDQVVQDAADEVTGYFDANLPAVIGVIVAVSLVLWIVGMALRAVRAKRTGI